MVHEVFTALSTMNFAEDFRSILKAIDVEVRSVTLLAKEMSLLLKSTTVAELVELLCSPFSSFSRSLRAKCLAFV